MRERLLTCTRLGVLRSTGLHDDDILMDQASSAYHAPLSEIKQVDNVCTMHKSIAYDYANLIDANRPWSPFAPAMSVWQIG